MEWIFLFFPRNLILAFALFFKFFFWRISSSFFIGLRHFFSFFFFHSVFTCLSLLFFVSLHYLSIFCFFFLEFLFFSESCAMLFHSVFIPVTQSVIELRSIWASCPAFWRHFESDEVCWDHTVFRDFPTPNISKLHFPPSTSSRVLCTTQHNWSLSKTTKENKIP